MIEHWKPIGALPTAYGAEFFGTERFVRNRKNAVRLRRSKIYIAHPFEQFVNDDWHPAFVKPVWWKDAPPRS